MNAEEEKNRLFEIISGHMRINGSEYCSTSEFESDIEDAAEEIYKELTTLRAQLAEAREIIEPFAAEAGMWGSKTSDGETPIIRGSDGKGDEAAFTVGDLRKAQKWYDKVTTA